MTGTLGRDHDDVDFLGRLDEAEVDAQAVREQQAFALGKIGRDILLVDAGLFHVGQTDHDDVGAAHGLGGVENLEPVLPRDLPGFRAGIQADDDVAAAVLQIEGMGVAL